MSGDHSTPRRIRLSRAKGWSLPPDAIVVARPSRFGNPFTVTTKMRPGTAIVRPRSAISDRYWAVPTIEDAVACFLESVEADPRFQEEIRAALRGHNLACWCALDQPCHADVLLNFANREVPE